MSSSGPAPSATGTAGGALGCSGAAWNGLPRDRVGARCHPGQRVPTRWVHVSALQMYASANPGRRRCPVLDWAQGPKTRAKAPTALTSQGAGWDVQAPDRTGHEQGRVTVRRPARSGARKRRSRQAISTDYSPQNAWIHSATSAYVVPHIAAYRSAQPHHPRTAVRHPTLRSGVVRDSTHADGSLSQPLQGGSPHADRTAPGARSYRRRLRAYPRLRPWTLASARAASDAGTHGLNGSPDGRRNQAPGACRWPGTHRFHLLHDAAGRHQ